MQQKIRMLPYRWIMCSKNQTNCDGNIKIRLFLTKEEKRWYLGSQTTFSRTAPWIWGTWMKTMLGNTLHLFMMTDELKGRWHPWFYVWWVGVKCSWLHLFTIMFLYSVTKWPMTRIVEDMRLFYYQLEEGHNTQTILSSFKKRKLRFSLFLRDLADCAERQHWEKMLKVTNDDTEWQLKA